MLHCFPCNAWRNYFLIKDNDLLDVLCPSRLISYWSVVPLLVVPDLRQYLKPTCQILWFETFYHNDKIWDAFNGGAQIKMILLV